MQLFGTPDEVRAPVSGTAQRAECANCRIACHSPAIDTRSIAQECEAWRSKLLATWRPNEEVGPWTVKCQIVIHASRASYVAAVGRGGQSSFGSTWIDFAGPAVAKRRIDLLPDLEGQLSALGHEMTHVVVADCFGGKQLPRWADEGMAILADHPHKRQLHQRDLQAGLAQQQAFSCAELLTMEDYPSASRIPAFYGQSASVVALLCRRKPPAEFLKYVRRSLQVGNSTALHETYGLSGLHELEQLWRRDPAAALDFHGFRLAIAP
jgi:hypothetical protein